MTREKHKVYPVPGTFTPGEPHIVREVDTKKEAERLVKTGSFAHSRADAVKASPWSAEAIAEAEDAAAVVVAEAEAPEPTPPEADSAAEPVLAGDEPNEETS